MPTERSQTWEKQPDGSMKLLRDEIAQVPDDPERANRARLRELTAKRSWTKAELEEALRSLLEAMGYAPEPEDA